MALRWVWSFPVEPTSKGTSEKQFYKYLAEVWKKDTWNVGCVNSSSSKFAQCHLDKIWRCVSFFQGHSSRLKIYILYSSSSTFMLMLCTLKLHLIQKTKGTFLFEKPLHCNGYSVKQLGSIQGDCFQQAAQLHTAPQNCSWHPDWA